MPSHELVVATADPQLLAACLEVPVVQVCSTTSDSLEQAGAHEGCLAAVLELPSTTRESMERIRQANPDLPMIVTVRREDEDSALRALDVADDYLLQDQMTPEGVAHAVRHARHCRTLRRELHAAQVARRGLSEAADSLAALGQRLRSFTTLVEELTGAWLRSRAAADTAPTGRDELLDLVACESAEMSRVADDLVDAAAAQRGDLRLWRRRLSLERLMTRVRLGAEGLRAPTGLEVTVSPLESPLELYGDEHKLARGLLRLLARIVEWCPGIQRLRMTATCHDGTPRLGLLLAGAAPTRGQLERLQAPPGSLELGAPDQELSLAKRLLDLQLAKLDVDAQSGELAVWVDLPPANLEWQLARHAARFTATGATEVSCVSVALSGAGPGAAEANAAQLIQQVLPADAFCWPLDARRWIIAAPGAAERIGGALRRLAATWSLLKTDDDGLPDLACDAPETLVWPLGRRRLEQRVRELAESRPTAQRRILLLEDRPGENSLQRRLQEAGYRVQAQDMRLPSEPQPDADDAERPQAIVVDARAPEGLASWERLRETGAPPEVPIILLTASLRDQQRVLQEGARFVPCDVQGGSDDLLLDVLAEAVGR